MEHSRKRHTFFLVVATLLAAGSIGAFGWSILDNVQRAEIQNPALQSDAEIVQKDVPAEIELTAEASTPQQKPIFEVANLQAVLEKWQSSTSGTASVSVVDIDGTAIAGVNTERPYFTASIYKLYVAYFGYQEVDSGAKKAEETVLIGRTRAQCLELMIRESDSPCGEKVMSEITKVVLNQKIRALGINNTDMGSLSTTASDTSKLLGIIARGEGLSVSSQNSLLESMKMQIYRDALNKGFSANVTIYNKIGFNELKEYHDVAIVELADGRRFIVAVLTSGVGTRNIADLGAQIEALILE